MTTKSSRDTLLTLFDSRTVVDLPAIRETLGGKSVMTAFRHLKGLPYRRSYNHNGRYYARHVPGRYDRFGLWSHGDVHFSIDGSLKETVRRLVCEAEAGATQRELQERLRVRVHNTLLGLVRSDEVHRSDIGGVYLYCHVEASVREAQHERRREDIARAAGTEAQVDDQVIIRVLLVLIRHPGSTAADVVARLRGHAPPIALRQIESVFARYELGVKRGVPRS